MLPGGKRSFPLVTQTFLARFFTLSIFDYPSLESR